MANYASPKPARVGRLLLTCLLGAVGLAACGDFGTRCDPDQKFSNGVCYAPDAAPPTADANLKYAHFGDVCTMNAECALPTAFCAILPGASAGYCTGVGCLADPSVCPPGWGCTDLSVYAPGLPSICTAP